MLRDCVRSEFEDREMTRRALTCEFAPAFPLLLLNFPIVSLPTTYSSIRSGKMAAKRKQEQKTKPARRSTTKTKNGVASKHFIAEKDARVGRRAANLKGRKNGVAEDSSATPEDSEGLEDTGSAYDDESDEDEPELDSDHLDSDFETAGKKRKGGKTSSKKGSSKKSPRKKQKRDEDEDFEDDLEEGQELIGHIVEAPKTGRGVWPFVIPLGTPAHPPH